ncbi:hypothetical protein GEV33_012960 [Tenebrio molitor]|uniref:Neurotransmitter-gated ion-channel ligand-binding domain-containing protein n=1 Tax=Tenebrio molitor TaxID=7067 RepID=A0A8J6H8N8_TENMO|nr:hypothetical protein GEV33_012960 [Tenebrio molitor]
MLVRAAAILLVTRQTLALSDIFEDGKSDKEILDNLLRATRYDKRLLPPVQDADFCCGLQSPEDAKLEIHNIPSSSKQRETVKVDVSVLLLSLASPDESSLKYEVEFLLQQQWFDPRLKYSNQSQYNFLNAIHHHNDIWLPDTYFIMHGDFKDPLIPMHFSLRIYRNGTVFYSMRYVIVEVYLMSVEPFLGEYQVFNFRRHLILSCQGHLNIFPFDDPECSFSLESISYEMKSIKYVWKNDEDVLKKSASLATLNAYLIKNQTLECNWNNNWRDMTHSPRENPPPRCCFGFQYAFGRVQAQHLDMNRVVSMWKVVLTPFVRRCDNNAQLFHNLKRIPFNVAGGIEPDCHECVGCKFADGKQINYFIAKYTPVVKRVVIQNHGTWKSVALPGMVNSKEFVRFSREKKLELGRNGPRFYQWLLIRLYVVWSVMLQRLPAVLSRIGIILASPLVRKKEPPHPIRVAKTIDVIARITFPTAFAVFLIFFFYHYSSYTHSDEHT